MSSNKQITVIGATGNLGTPVVKNLARLGFELKVIARNKEKAGRLLGNLTSVEIVQADLENVDSLREALKGTSVLYLSLSTNTVSRDVAFAPEREGVANILMAIDRSSISQIISISGLGAYDNYYSQEAFQFIPNIIRKEGHKLIKESGIPYTILHCSSFIDNFALYLRKGVYSVIGSTTTPIYFTNCYDFSVILANSIGNRKAMYREFAIQGEEGLLHTQAAEEFFSVYEPAAKASVFPGWLLRLLAAFSKEMKFVKHMADYFSNSPEEFIAEESGTFEILGSPTISLRDYASKLKNENFYSYLKN